MTWEKRYEKLIFTDSEEETIKTLINSVLERTEPDNPLEFAFLSEQFARLAGHQIALEEQKSKEKYVKNLFEEK